MEGSLEKAGKGKAQTRQLSKGMDYTGAGASERRRMMPVIPAGRGVAEQWWILPNGDERQVPVNDPFGIIFESPADFGLTKEDCAFAKQRIADGGFLALIDKICFAGGLWIKVDADPTKQWATICFWAERTEDGLFDVTSYRRIAQWLRNRKASKKAVVLLRELSTMRGWMQPVEMLLTAPEDQFTDKPGHDRCPGCHKHVSHEEIVVKKQCPHCGMMLV